MSFVEPGLHCQQCGRTYRMTEGVRLSMRCAACDAALHLDGKGTPSAPRAPDDPLLVGEVWLPAKNTEDAQAVRQFVAALPLPVALEYYGDDQRRCLLVRGPRSVLQSVAAQLSARWPRAQLHLLETDPTAAVRADANSTFAWHLSFAEPEFLPLRTWTTFLDGDPVQGLLAALLGLETGEGVWFQMRLHRPARPDWLAAAQRRLKLESQRGFAVAGEPAPGDLFIRRTPVVEGVDLTGGCFWIGLCSAAVLLITLFLLGQPVLAIVLGLLLVMAGGLGVQWLARRADPWQAADLTLVRQKVIQQEQFWQVSCQLALRAPNTVRAEALRQRWEAALGQYALTGGNRFLLQAASTLIDPWQIHESNTLLLGTDELAGLWHPPLVSESVAPGVVPVSVVEMRAPDPEEVRGFYRIGAYQRTDGQHGAVSISARTCRGNLFLIGKPGVGKTTLMESLALANIRHPERPAVLVIDPHGDMASRLTGLIGPAEIERVRLMDVKDTEYLLTYNPLDIHAHGGSPESIAQLIVDVGRQLWEDFWGPRMQVPLSRGVQLLAAANELRDPGDLFGLSLLAAIIGTRHELRRGFLAAELTDGEEYQELRRYFNEDFRQLSPSMREQIIQPVLSKALRFRDETLLPLFSCPRSMLNLGQVIAERQILIVNTRMTGVGVEMSDFIGSLLLNVLLRQIARQGEQQRTTRVPVTVIVDEFQTYTGVPWAEWVQQMRKWGGGVILGTQSLASLRAGQGVELPGIITSGTASLFVFTVNGEDADYLARNELSQKAGGPGPESLVNLPPYHAYTRLLKEDGSVSRPFTLVADPPLPYQETVAAAVRARRMEYSLPYAEALRRAREKLNYLDRFAAAPQPSSLGTQAPGTQVAQVLLEQAGRSPAPPNASPAGRPGSRAAFLEGDADFADEVANELGAFFPSAGSSSSQAEDGDPANPGDGEESQEA